MNNSFLSDKKSAIDTEMLVKSLREAGANLPQETLSKKMTRN
jgi:hypothetical protein